MISLRQVLLVLLTALVAACASQSGTLDSDDGQPTGLVLTSTGPLYSMTAALLENTDVEVLNVPERARGLGSQPTWFRTQGQTAQDLFERADVVVTMDHLWHEDPLYISVREQNIRVIQIDATLPFSSEATGVSVVNSGADGYTLPMYWLSPANLIRSLKIISLDLQRIFPEQAEQILAREQSITARLVNAKSSAEARLLQVVDPFVYALADEFDYLTNEYGIFVDGYFIKQDLDWTEQDLANLTQHLQDWDIPVVIHKWEPSEAIQQAVADGGAQLVVLDTFETYTGPLGELATGNINKLLEALSSN